MNPTLSSSRLRLSAVLAMAAAGLAWLLLVVAGNRTGMQALPDAAGSTVEVLAGFPASLSPEEAAGKPPSVWSPWDGRSGITAPRGRDAWVRVTLRNPSSAAMPGILADTGFYTDHLDLWMADNAVTGSWLHQEAGEWVPASEKAAGGRTPAFFVEVPALGKRVVYLKAQDHFGVWLHPAWWPDRRAFLAAQMRTTALEGAYFGVLFALLVYNGVLWVRLRFSDIGHYLAYLLAMSACLFVAREGYQTLGLAMGSPAMETVLMFSLGMSGVFLAQFARAFFNLKALAPQADRAVQALSFVMLVLAAGTLTGLWFENDLWRALVLACFLVTHGALIWAAGVAWRAGAGQARYFLLSIGVWCVGLSPAAGIWLPAWVSLEFAELAAMSGTGLELLLLSLAVTERFAQLQREKLAAQEKLVEEAEQRRVMQEAYADELEVEVRERTGELEAANADKDRMIAVLGHDLRSPLTGLTQAAEHLRGGLMAAEALGAPSCAAERFVNEAARTGRQLLLMIEDRSGLCCATKSAAR